MGNSKNRSNRGKSLSKRSRKQQLHTAELSNIRRPLALIQPPEHPRKRRRTIPSVPSQPPTPRPTRAAPASTSRTTPASSDSHSEPSSPHALVRSAADSSPMSRSPNPVGPQKHRARPSPVKKKVDYRQKYESVARKARRQRETITRLGAKEAEAAHALKATLKRAELAEGRLGVAVNEGILVQSRIEKHQRDNAKLREDKRELQRTKKIIEKRYLRAKKTATRASSALKASRSAKMKKGRTYAQEFRQIARVLVHSGVARERVGAVIIEIASLLGVILEHRMSARTVGRVVLEGLIASQLQVGFEWSLCKTQTISADSTGYRHQNYESRYSAHRVPDYAANPLVVNPKSVPRLRLIALAATEDHTAQGSVNGWKGDVDHISAVLGRSPLAHRLNIQFTATMFANGLTGMSGDHANNEKATAEGMRAWKHDLQVRDLAMKKLTPENILNNRDLVLYLQSFNLKKISDAGGPDAWAALSPIEQSRRDRELLDEILLDLGEKEFKELPQETRREMLLFIWSGCCMHKDMNSFKGGNTEMMKEWEVRGWTPPVVLANKQNAKRLKDVLAPGGKPYEEMTEEEREALENSTRGAAKALKIAGAVFANTNENLGQGDAYSTEFDERFASTTTNRFGSFGRAACQLLRRLPQHRAFVKTLGLAKSSTTKMTNIELNLERALDDVPTITEMCAMAIYTVIIAIPYDRIVRGTDENGDTPNALSIDLLELHREVHAHIDSIIEDPELIFGRDATPECMSLDSRPWSEKDAEAMSAVFELAPTLPHLVDVTIAFFRGSLATWHRFCAEFAPGGTIDEATEDEREQSWRPATNCVNEGRLADFKVKKRNKPTLTLHAYNAEAMFSANRTIEFMNALFDEEDYLFIMREARKLDASGLEKQRKVAQREFRARLVEVNRLKEAEKAERAAERNAKLSAIVLIPDASALDRAPPGQKRWVGKLYDEQLDALKERNVEISPARSSLKVPEKLAALRVYIPRYAQEIIGLNLTYGDVLPKVLKVRRAQDNIIGGHADEEDAEIRDRGD